MHRMPTHYNPGRGGSFAPLAQGEHENGHEIERETETEAGEEGQLRQHRLSGKERFRDQVQQVIRQSSITHDEQHYEPVQAHQEYTAPLASTRVIRGTWGSPPEELQDIEIAELGDTYVEYYGPRAPSSLSKESDAPTESTYVDDKDKFFYCAYEAPVVGIDEKGPPPSISRPKQGFSDYRPFALKSSFSLILLLLLAALLGLTVYSMETIPTKSQVLDSHNPPANHNGTVAGLKLRDLVPIRVFGRGSVLPVRLSRAEQNGNATQPDEPGKASTGDAPPSDTRKTTATAETPPAKATSAQPSPTPDKPSATTDVVVPITPPKQGPSPPSLSTPEPGASKPSPPKPNPPQEEPSKQPEPTKQPEHTKEPELTKQPEPSTPPMESPTAPPPEKTSIPSSPTPPPPQDHSTTDLTTPPKESPQPPQTFPETKPATTDGDGGVKPPPPFTTPGAGEPVKETHQPSPTKTLDGQVPGKVCTETVMLTITKTSWVHADVNIQTIQGRDIPVLVDIFGRRLDGPEKRVAVPVKNYIPRQVQDCVSTITTTNIIETTVTSIILPDPPPGGSNPNPGDNPGQVPTPGPPKQTDKPGENPGQAPNPGKPSEQPGIPGGIPNPTSGNQVPTPPPVKIPTINPDPETKPGEQLPPKPTGDPDQPKPPIQTPDPGHPAQPPTPNPGSPVQTPTPDSNPPKPSNTPPIGQQPPPPPLPPGSSTTPPVGQAPQPGNTPPPQQQPTPPPAAGSKSSAVPLPLATSDPEEVPPPVLGVVSTPRPAANTPPPPQQQGPENTSPPEKNPDDAPSPPQSTPPPQLKKPENTPVPPHTITVVIPTEVEYHSTMTSTSIETTTDPIGAIFTQERITTMDVVQKVVSQSTVIYTDWTETGDFMTYAYSILTDAAGVPTATLSSLVNMAPFLTTYTDAEGHATSTGTAWHQNPWKVRTKTNERGGLTTETFLSKTTTETLKNEWGQATGTTTVVVTETLAVTTMYDPNGVPTTTRTMWEPVTMTSTAIVTPTVTSNSSRNGFTSANLAGLNLSSKDYFVGLVLPPFLAVAISIPVRILDQTAKLYQPFHALTSKHGAETVDSLCLQSSGLLGFVTGIQSLMRHQVLLAVTGLLLLINAILIPLSAEAFSISVKGPGCSPGTADSLSCDVTLQAFPILIKIGYALLSAMILLVIATTITLWKWKTGVWQNPWSMEVMGLLAVNEEFRTLMKKIRSKNGGVITNKDAIKAFGQRRFSLEGRYYIDGWAYGVVIKNDAGSLLKRNKKSVGFSKRGKRSKAMPFFVLSLWGRVIALLVLVALLITSLVYISTGTNSTFERFMDGDSFGVRFLFCGVGVVISLFWATFFNAVAFLSPYRLYRKHDDKATLLTPPTNAYSGLWEVCHWRHPDGYLGLVAFTSILSDVLPVLLANVPSKTMQASTTHLLCTWFAAAILSQMLVVVTWSFLVDWPHMSMNPATVAGAMYFALDPGTFMSAYSVRSSTPGGRSSQV